MKFIFSIFIILHGLVHMWYFILSRQLVAFKPEMGWTGESWLFTYTLGDTVTRFISSIIYVIATAAFLLGGISLIASASWWQTIVTVSAVFSAVAILLFWDGRIELIVQRGLIGLLINIAIIVLIRGFHWPEVQ